MPPSSFTSLNDSIFCGLLSSLTSKSLSFKSEMGLPALSVMMTSTRTKLMLVLNEGGCCAVGWSCAGGVCCGGCACCAVAGFCWDCASPWTTASETMAASPIAVLRVVPIHLLSQHPQRDVLLGPVAAALADEADDVVAGPDVGERQRRFRASGQSGHRQLCKFLTRTAEQRRRHRRSRIDGNRCADGDASRPCEFGTRRALLRLHAVQDDEGRCADERYCRCRRVREDPACGSVGGGRLERALRQDQLVPRRPQLFRQARQGLVDLGRNRRRRRLGAHVVILEGEVAVARAHADAAP